MLFPYPFIQAKKLTELLPVWSVPVPNGIHVMTFDESSDEVVCASAGGYITTLTAETGKVSRTATTGPNGMGPGVNWTVFHNHGRCEERWMLQTHGGAVLNLRTLTLGPSLTKGDSRNIWAFSPDGNWYYHDGKIKPSRRGAAEFTAPKGYGIALGPYLKQFAAWTMYERRQRFDIYSGTDGKITNSFEWMDNEIRNPKFSPDGRYFTFFDNNRYGNVIFETTGFKKVAVLEGMPVELVFSSDSEWATNVGWEFSWTAKGPAPVLAHLPDGRQYALKESPTSPNGYDYAAMAAAFSVRRGMLYIADSQTVMAFMLPKP